MADGRTYVGSRGLTASLMRAIGRGINMLDAQCLTQLTFGQFEDIYRDETTGTVTLQMIADRQRVFNQLGGSLLSRYSGRAESPFREAQGMVFRDEERGLIQQRCLLSPALSFCDWPFMGLAFLPASIADARLCLNIPTTDEYRSLVRIHDWHNFQGMTDYYIPFFFMRVGILSPSVEFRAHLARQIDILPESELGESYRACQLIAMRAISEDLGNPGLITQFDYECWRQGYLKCRLCHAGATDLSLPCAYRALCAAANERPELAAIRWPLVLTTSYWAPEKDGQPPSARHLRQHASWRPVPPASQASYSNPPRHHLGEESPHSNQRAPRLSPHHPRGDQLLQLVISGGQPTCRASASQGPRC